MSLLKEIWCVCMQQIQEASLKNLNHFLDPFTKTAPLDTEQHWQQAHMEGTHRPDCCFTGTLLYFSVTRGGVALVNLLNILDYKINRLGHQEKSLGISRSLWSNQAGGKWQLPWLRWDAQGATSYKGWRSTGYLWTPSELVFHLCWILWLLKPAEVCSCLPVYWPKCPIQLWGLSEAILETHLENESFRSQTKCFAGQEMTDSMKKFNEAVTALP